MDSGVDAGAGCADAEIAAPMTIAADTSPRMVRIMGRLENTRCDKVAA